MKKFAIDLSLRSTGISHVEEKRITDFFLVKNSDLNNEELVIDNCEKIINWMKEKNASPDVIRVEGLSFNSTSGSKDIIAGQFWCLRCKLIQEFKDAKLEIIPVLTWRSPLFTKEDRLSIKEAGYLIGKGKKKTSGLKGDKLKKAKEFNEELESNMVKLGKKSLTGLKGPLRKEIQNSNKILELNASIKERTWLKLDNEIQKQILDFINTNKYNKDSKYDITDSIFIGLYEEK